MMLYIYTKFHENVPKGFSVIERTRNHDVWTDGHTDGRTDKVISIDRQTPPELLMDGWMDGWMTCDFTSFSTVFQSYQDDGRLIMKDCVQ